MDEHAEVFGTAFHAIAASPVQAAQMVARAQLMMQIQDIIRRHGWTQTEAARRCGVSQPRISLLLSDQFGQFTLDALVKIAANLGQRIEIALTDSKEAA